MIIYSPIVLYISENWLLAFIVSINNIVMDILSVWTGSCSWRCRGAARGISCPSQRAEWPDGRQGGQVRHVFNRDLYVNQLLQTTKLNRAKITKPILDFQLLVGDKSYWNWRPFYLSRKCYFGCWLYLSPAFESV